MGRSARTPLLQLTAALAASLCLVRTVAIRHEVSATHITSVAYQIIPPVCSCTHKAHIKTLLTTMPAITTTTTNRYRFSAEGASAYRSKPRL